MPRASIRSMSPAMIAFTKYSGKMSIGKMCIRDRPWARRGDVCAAIQEQAEKNGYSVVRDLCGHGCGVKFHEEPDVEHFGKRGTGMLRCV